ncbi:hypothetical protein VTN31DRAFT_2517 [Thermomyces dupontii]|uniref:uncharacterized protein n=1 Tax=Talaromyces thermophilus TaxID=28565 RepID=UPI0037441901
MDTLKLRPATSLSTVSLCAAILIPIALIPVIHRQWPQLLPPLLHLPRRKKGETTDIVELRVYPIKSCRGFTVRKTTLRTHGLDLDRRWMFVDAATHEFLTIRQIPQMTLINTALSEDGQSLILSIRDKDQEGAVCASIPAYPTADWLRDNTTLAQVKIWDVQTDGYLYGPEVNEPFSRFLGRNVCLAYKGPTPRVLRGNGAPERLGRTQHTFFPDVHPVLIASEASLADLNGRLEAKGEQPVTIERFRPNIIVKGNLPWSEDSWKLVRLSAGEEERNTGTIDVDIVARCARCQVPNVEPSTAEKHKTEPWDTLMSFRRVDEGIKYKPCFGMLGAPRAEGEVSVGMKLEVLAETQDHRYVKGF